MNEDVLQNKDTLRIFGDNLLHAFREVLPDFPDITKCDSKKIRFGPERAVNRLETGLELELRTVQGVKQLVVHVISIKPEERGDAVNPVGSRIIDALANHARHIGIATLVASNVQLRAEDFWKRNYFDLLWEDGEWRGYRHMM